MRIIAKSKTGLMDLAKVLADCQQIRPVSTGIMIADFYSFSLNQRRFMTGATFRSGTLVALDAQQAIFRAVPRDSNGLAGLSHMSSKR
jgi:hypothetical protein